MVRGGQVTGQVYHLSENGVAVLTLKGPSANALTADVRASLMDRLLAATTDRDCRAIVISGAGGMFSSGVDLAELEGPEREPSVGDIANVIEMSPKPVVAAIEGVAFGSGMALALATHARVMGPTARFALPNVRMGLIPGDGVTQRLPRMVGAQIALQLMLTGKVVQARDGALKRLVTHFADDAPEERAAEVALGLASSGGWARTRDLDIGFSDPQAYFNAVNAVAERLTHPKSAEAGVVTCVEAAMLLPFERGLEFEASVFDNCVHSEASRAMRHALTCERRGARVPGVDASTGLDITDVVVSGEGAMATEIVIMGLDAGWTIHLGKLVPFDAQKVRDRVVRVYDAAVMRGKMNAATYDDRLSRLHTEVQNAPERHVHLCLGEMPEDAPEKGIAVGIVPETWSGPVGDAASDDSNRMWLRLHAPAHVRPVAEIAIPDQIHKRSVATLLKLLGKTGKSVIRSGFVPGLFGAGLEWVLYSAALALNGAGARMEDIDTAARSLGFAEGPFRMMDRIGLPLVAAKLTAMSERIGKPATLGILPELARSGAHGRATGRGFYTYDGENIAPNDKDMAGFLADAVHWDVAVLKTALLAAIANMAADLLGARAALRASDIELILTKAMGFERRLGGPLFQADCTGLFALMQAMTRHAAISPEIWKPCSRIRDMVKNGEGFFARPDFSRG